jgi:predicted nuclease of restriction endonuclease-like (RecB) superfamily
MTKDILNKDYSNFLFSLKERVTTSRYKAALAVNKELLSLYHHIGTEVLESKKKFGWGAKVSDQLSKDLRIAFPEMKGFSPRNLRYMQKFASEYPEPEFRQQAAAQLPWGHIIFLLDTIPDKTIRQFYIEKTIEHGWSRNIMAMQIESDLHKRIGAALTNFKDKMPSPQSELAQNTLKDPYLFDFLTIGEEARERDIENALMKDIERFLLELGEGFAFVGRQCHLEVGGQDFFIDLLFYHLKLSCFYVIELKNGDFKPEYAGKMNFYLSAVDDNLKRPGDNPSIGLILCKSKNNILAEYALRDMTKPIGLAEYRLKDALPKNLQSSLPTIEEIEAELSKNLEDNEEGEIKI